MPCFESRKSSWLAICSGIPCRKKTGSPKPAESKAPDVMVIFGQEKGDRRSYKQWEEGNLGSQVTFEFVSKTNSKEEVEGEKLRFYQKYGVEEYYIHDPDEGTLKGWIREGSWFQPIVEMTGWISPRLEIRFELIGPDLQLYYPNGEPFETYPEIMAQRERERQLRQQAELRAEQAERECDRERQRAERLAERLRTLNIDADTVD